MTSASRSSRLENWPLGRDGNQNPERRPDNPAIDERRSGIPLISPGDRVESRESLENAVRADAQDARIVCPHIDGVDNRHAA